MNRAYNAWTMLVYADRLGLSPDLEWDHHPKLGNAYSIVEQAERQGIRLRVAGRFKAKLRKDPQVSVDSLISMQRVNW